MDEMQLLVSVLTSRGSLVERREPEVLLDLEPEDFAQFRVPAAHRNQSHKPMLFWSAQIGRHIWCESRLEGASLRRKEFYGRMTAAIPQPFAIRCRVGKKVLEHIPDFLIWEEPSQRVLTNIKPRKFVDHERNQRAFAACEALADQLGWRYELLTEADPVVHENLRFLGGYRRAPFDLKRYSAEIVERLSFRRTIDEVLVGLEPSALAKPVLFHLMWNRIVMFDETKILRGDTELWLGTSKLG